METIKMTSQRRPTLPDTEPMTESQESEAFYSQPVQISWGRLFCKYIKNETVGKLRFVI